MITEVNRRMTFSVNANLHVHHRASYLDGSTWNQAKSVGSRGHNFARFCRAIKTLMHEEQKWGKNIPNGPHTFSKCVTRNFAYFNRSRCSFTADADNSIVKWMVTPRNRVLQETILLQIFMDISSRCGIWSSVITWSFFYARLVQFTYFFPSSLGSFLILLRCWGWRMM
jgi:hypothetical protein